MEDKADERTEEILGITRCAQCGQRLEGEVDCPFCSAMRGFDPDPDERPGQRVPLWIYLTAILMAFPLSLPWLVMSGRLNLWQKAATLAAGIIWMSTVIWFL